MDLLRAFSNMLLDMLLQKYHKTKPSQSQTKNSISGHVFQPVNMEPGSRKKNTTKGLRKKGNI